LVLGIGGWVWLENHNFF